MTGNVYPDLTNEFNDGELRAILSEGLAVVVHQLAVVSKDGDWIVRETPEALAHVLGVLESHGARYRLGASLDVRWMRGGWSAHFDWQSEGYRARADFVTRPPRLSLTALEALWHEQEAGASESLPVPTIDLRRLIELKKTDRGRDYIVIGELARRLEPLPQLLASQSALDIMDLAKQHPDVLAVAKAQRPALEEVSRDVEDLELALFQERRGMIKANQERLLLYSRRSQGWKESWREIEKDIQHLLLRQAHELLVQKAEQLLPIGEPLDV